MTLDLADVLIDGAVLEHEDTPGSLADPPMRAARFFVQGRLRDLDDIFLDPHVFEDRANGIQVGFSG